MVDFLDRHGKRPPASTPHRGIEVLLAGKKEELDNLSILDSDQAELRMAVSEGTSSEILILPCAVARGRALVFADDDSVFPKDWLVTIEQALIAFPDYVVLTGRILVPVTALVAGVVGDIFPFNHKWDM